MGRFFFVSVERYRFYMKFRFCCSFRGFLFYRFFFEYKYEDAFRGIYRRFRF